MADCISLQPRKRRCRQWVGGAIGIVTLLASVEFSSAISFGAPGNVTAVRFWSLGEVTRIAIDVSSDFRYRADRLTNPDRFFFDIQGARPALPDKKMYTIAVGDPLLKQIRVAETQPGVTRVVLDLESQPSPIEFTASQLSNPDRLMVELRVKDKPAPPVTGSLSGGTILAGAPSSVPEPDLIAPLSAGSASKAQADFTPLPSLPAVTAQITPPPSAPVTARIMPPPVAPAVTARITPPPAISSKVVPGPRVPGPSPMPAKPNTSGDESLIRVLGLKLGRVVIDPGHGGHDVGTHGPSGLYEKDVVLDVAQRLGSLLQQRLGSEVIYTRSDDTFIPLEQRTQLANDHKADLFLSIHANSSPTRSAAGVETYYLNFTTSKTALDLAAKENASSQRSIFELKDVLQKIAMKDKIDESREFASHVQNSLYAIEVKSNASAAKNRGVKKAPFVVLVGASMPSVLAEIGFLTNSADEALLRKPEQRQKIAEALYKGIASYAGTLSHFQVAKRN